MEQIFKFAEVTMESGEKGAVELSFMVPATIRRIAFDPTCVDALIIDRLMLGPNSEITCPVLARDIDGIDPSVDFSEKVLPSNCGIGMAFTNNSQRTITFRATVHVTFSR